MDQTEHNYPVFRFVHHDYFPPFSIYNQCESDGLTIDIIDAALARVDAKAAYFPESLDRIQDVLQTGKVDGIGLFAINSSRQKTYDYSDPLIITGGGLFPEISSPALFDLEDYTGKTICTPVKGPLAAYIERTCRDINMLDAPDYPSALKAVLLGKAAADIVNKSFQGKFNIPHKFFLKIPMGVAVLKDSNSHLLELINRGLNLIKQDGTYDRIYNKWIKKNI